MKSKKAAMEMSVGTIVTIVLLMSVLVLGLFLIKNIFSSAKGAVDLTDQQLRSEIEKLFSEETKVVIYPTSRVLELKHDEPDAIGVGIRNLGSSASASNVFSYTVIPTDNDCGLTDEQVSRWIRLGKSESDIKIPIGELETVRVTFEVPTGTPLCLADFKVEVENENGIYKTERFQIRVSS
jgi:hypothetical protein